MPPIPVPLKPDNVRITHFQNLSPGNGNVTVSSNWYAPVFAGPPIATPGTSEVPPVYVLEQAAFDIESAAGTSANVANVILFKMSDSESISGITLSGDGTSAAAIASGATQLAYGTLTLSGGALGRTRIVFDISEVDEDDRQLKAGERLGILVEGTTTNFTTVVSPSISLELTTRNQ